jgi:hypothetical protein
VEPGSVVLSGSHVVVLGAVVGEIADVGALWSLSSPLGVAGILEVGDRCWEFRDFGGVGVCGVGRVLFICSYVCLLLLMGDSLGAVVLSVGAVEAQMVAMEVAVYSRWGEFVRRRGAVADVRVCC